MKKVLIIGAGPAGLAAAYRLIKKSNIKPIIIDECTQVGGISKTINYKGNRMDIGGHRFFSKSEEVNNLWENIIPLETGNFNSCSNDNVFLRRNRVSRIFFLKKFFDYPISLNWGTVINLGVFRMFKIIFSYLKIKVFSIKNEKSLEDFFINRFGRELYLTFFKDYTEKLWGTKCSEISSEWGRQRIKSFSVGGAIKHILKKLLFFRIFFKKSKTETTLIDSFLYPKFGPGQMYEEMSNEIQKNDGKLLLQHKVIELEHSNQKITNIKIKNLLTGEIFDYYADFVISSMPVKDLVSGLNPAPNDKILDVANGLLYRDFITVGLLLKELKVKNKTKIKTHNNLIPDNWLYIQEKNMKLGRLQIFNNWSPFLVENQDNVWLGLEYFGNFDDSLFSKSDEDFKKFAILELEKIGIIEKDNVLDSVIVRVPKAYPAYFGSYNQFDVVKKFVDSFENLFLIGRNGMHRYNNMDHSILTGLLAADNIINGIKSKDALWKINTEEKYCEEKQN